MTELKLLSEYCNFGLSLEDIIMNRLLCGVRNPKIQQSLQAETNFSLKRAWKKVCAMERANSNVCGIKEGVCEVKKVEKTVH